MTESTHDQFTLLYEDEDTKVLHEFKEILADRVIQHMIDFLKGCGYMEDSIFETMKELSDDYFSLLTTATCGMERCKPEAE
jgi:peptide deformylase